MLHATRTIMATPEGGTYDTFAETAPTTGYWVGGAGSVLTFPSVDRMSPSMIEAFVHHGTVRYVGWWTDAETGKVWLDAVEWIPTLSGAASIARNRGEIAFWDIANDREIRV